MIESLEKLLAGAATQVFATVLNFPVEIDVARTPLDGGVRYIAGTVGLTGRINGGISVTMSDDYARQLASQWWGLPLAEVTSEDLLGDTVGELTNMVAGRIKSQLCDLGLKCVITVPAVERGKNLLLKPTSEGRGRICLRCRGNPVVTDVWVGPQQGNMQACLQKF